MTTPEQRRERARLIDQEEFQAESKALLARALQAAEQKRKYSCPKVEAFIKRGFDYQSDSSQRKAERQSKRYPYNGKLYTITELAKIAVVSKYRLTNRIRNGMDIHKAVTTPPQVNNTRHIYQGKEQSVDELSKIAGIPSAVIYNRLRDKWEIHRAVTTPVRARRSNKTKEQVMSVEARG